ncbi:unnamed protein product, partial [Choristocarpus tenellus]
MAGAKASTRGPSPLDSTGRCFDLYEEVSATAEVGRQMDVDDGNLDEQGDLVTLGSLFTRPTKSDLPKNNLETTLPGPNTPSSAGGVQTTPTTPLSRHTAIPPVLSRCRTGLPISLGLLPPATSPSVGTGLYGFSTPERGQKWKPCQRDEGVPPSYD